MFETTTSAQGIIKIHRVALVCPQNPMEFRPVQPMTFRHAILCKYQKVCQQPGSNVSHQLPTPRCNDALHGLTPVAIKDHQNP